MPQKQVVIIGSGCSGLAAIKTCIDEGLNPFCFESSSDIGGLWRINNNMEDDDRRGSVSSSTIMNTSKEMMAFSTFPPPKEFPNFMHHTKVLEYYRLYAERFKLRQHIQFNSQVECVKPNIKESNGCVKDTTQSNGNMNKNDASNTDSNISVNSKTTPNVSNSNCEICRNEDDKEHMNSDLEFDYNYNVITKDVINRDVESLENCMDDDKPWKVHIRDTITGKTRILYFDYVLVCTGHHAFINMPTIPGQSDFQGRIIHSRDLREPDKLKGSRHVVLGVGNSGCDMAVEISKKMKVFLSTRRGTWLMHRLQTRGLPADIAFSNRLVFATAFNLPNKILNALSARHLNQKIDHDLYGLRPRHGPIAAHPTVNDELPNRIACGQVVIKSNIRRLENRRVYFDDGTMEDDIDTIITATGYHIKYPFLDDSIISTDSNDNPLYLYMFPTTLTTHSLAIIGCVQPGGALAPVSEMQCRLAVKVFKREVRLPSQDIMVRDIQMKKGMMKNRYVNSPRHTVQVDYIPYMDQLAALIGCKPNIGRLLIQDPTLAIKCVLGPCTAYQYRLQGPGKWDAARETILTQMNRVVYPLKTRRCEKDRDDSKIAVFMLGIFLLCVAYGVYYLILLERMREI